MTIVERPAYLHARAVGERTPQNAVRFLKGVKVRLFQTVEAAARWLSGEDKM